TFDLSNYIAPHIQYRTWFANGGGNSNPNDTLTVWITNGTETVLIEKINNPKGIWRAANDLEVSAILEPTASMQLVFSTTDLSSSGHVLEAGVDEFLVTGDFISKTNNTIAFSKFTANPNPFTNSILISAEGLQGAQYTVSNVFGQILESGNCTKNASQMELGKTWVPGVYFIKLTDNKAGKLSTMQLIKQ
ncbi:MAG: T9SS type A sorting domain-containing protein, partial [Saprospiraceae bacterium]